MAVQLMFLGKSRSGDLTYENPSTISATLAAATPLLMRENRRVIETV
jgi:hypothetical protein